MKDIQAIRGAAFIRQLVAEGEHDRQDFKYLISDARKIARSISAFANNKGGRLIIGVKDNGVIAGVRNEEDIYVVEQAAERYCTPSQTIDFKAYKVEGLHVIIAEIPQAKKRPVMVDEGEGKFKAYYRVADENIAAHPLMVRAWQIEADNLMGPLDERHFALTALLSQKSLLDERQIALALHLSQSTADALIARLAAAGVLSFHYNGSRFLFGV